MGVTQPLSYLCPCVALPLCATQNNIDDDGQPCFSWGLTAETIDDININKQTKNHSYLRPVSRSCFGVIVMLAIPNTKSPSSGCPRILHLKYPRVKVCQQCISQSYYCACSASHYVERELGVGKNILSISKRLYRPQHTYVARASISQSHQIKYPNIGLPETCLAQLHSTQNFTRSTVPPHYISQTAHPRTQHP